MFSYPQNHFFSGKCGFQSSGWCSYIGVFWDNWFKCPISCQLIRGIDQIFDIIFPSGIGVYRANPAILGFDTLSCIGQVFTYSRPGFPGQNHFHPSFLCHSQNKECCWQLNSWCIVERKLCTILLQFISFTSLLTKTDPVTLTKRRSIPGKYKAYVLICVISYSISPLSVFSNHKIHQKLFYNHFKAIYELFYRHLESLNSAMFVCVYYENIFWMISRWNWICDGQWN